MKKLILCSVAALSLVACTSTKTETITDPVTGEVVAITTTETTSDVNWDELVIELSVLITGLFGLNYARNRTRRAGKNMPA